LVLGDLGRLPFRTTFEMVALFDVIEHCDDDLAALQQAQSSLARDGLLLVTVPANPKLWSVVDEAAGHRRRYRPEHLEAVLQRAGFETLYLTHFMAPLYPAVRLARALARHREAQQIVATELRVRPFWNTLLRFLLWPERLALARRWRLPLGSSLVALARHKP
jgi:SAM-dependent methyltransferase